MCDKDIQRYEELKFLFNNGKLVDEESQQEYTMLTNKYLKEKYKISYQKDGCRVRVNGKQIHKKDEETILKYLRWYEEQEAISLEQVFVEAKEHALNRLNKPIKLGTITEYNKMWDKHLINYAKKGIKSFTNKDILSIFKATKGLSKSEYNKLVDTLKLIFNYAYSIDVEYIDWDINATLRRIDRNDFVKEGTKKSSEELAFSKEETNQILEYCNENKDVKNCAIALLFGTGLRPGEVVALNKDSVNGSVLTIRRSEARYDSKDEFGKNHTIYEIQETVKTENALRNVVVFRCDWALEWLLQQGNDFICTEKGKILNTKNITDRLRLICNKLGIKHRSCNKIRKTVATELNEAGLSESDIIAQLGHGDIKVTKEHYIQDRTPANERLYRIQNLVTKSNN